MTLSKKASADRWWVVAAMSLPLFLLAADNFGVAVVLPQMSEDLNATVTVSNWFYSAFLLSFAALQLPIGRLGDLVGRRKVLLIGVVIFGIASVLCGVSVNSVMLIASRALEGAGAAMIYATSLSIVSNAFPPEERGTGIGVWSAIGLTGGALGPFLGGIATTTVGWRLFFFINLPIVVISLILVLAKVPESKDETATGDIDWAGFAVVTFALVLFSYAINQTAASGWISILVLGPLGVSIVAFAGFVFLERRERVPLVEFDIFKTRNYMAASIVAFFGNYTFAVIMVFAAQYAQSETTLDMSAAASGVAFLALSVPVVVMSIVTGRIIAAMGMRKPMAIGSALICISFGVLLFTSVSNGATIVIISLFLSGIGQGLSYNISTTAAMNEIPDSKAGVAGGMIASIRLIGMIIGVSLTTTILKAVETSRMVPDFAARGASLSPSDQTEVQGLVAGSDSAIKALQDYTGAQKTIVNSVAGDILTTGFCYAMVATALIGIVAVFGALLYHDDDVAADASTASAA